MVRGDLYIRNFRPDRWPAGTPDWQHAALPGNWLSDCDNGPTKTFLVDHADQDEAHRRLYELSFGMRPAEELYDLRRDPDQLVNVAGDPRFTPARERLWRELRAELATSGDPRIVGGADDLETHPYFGGGAKHPNWKRR